MSDPIGKLQPIQDTSSHPHNADSIQLPLSQTEPIQTPVATPLEQSTNVLTTPLTELKTGPEPTASQLYQLEMSGPGVNTQLTITDEQDLTIALALLEKIRRQLRAQSS